MKFCHIYVYRMWVVLGCEFDNVGHECMSTDTSFYGYLSQVNWYKRILTFQGTGGASGEISNNFANPQLIFEDTGSANPLANVVLVWNEYELESGIARIIPSEAKGVRCNTAGRTPPCSHFASK